jgi:dipeptidyl aminopeptidase/acylaminoacyl peptidase
MRLQERFSRYRAPGEDDAAERGWRVVRAGFEERPRRRRAGARRRWRPLAALAAGTAAIALVITPAGAEVGDWIRDVVDRDPAPAGPPPLTLPSGGRVLATTAAGPWIVNADGSQRLLGAYETATWSPQGMFVAVTRGRQLLALEPSGRVRWQTTTPAPIGVARWAASGFRIAYLSGSRSGYEVPPRARRSDARGPAQALRVINGDGTGDRLLARAVAETPPAWRPGPAHALAFADRRGRVVVRDADSGALLWRSAPGAPALQLAWSADGERLAAVGVDRVRIFAGDGRELRSAATAPLVPPPLAAAGALVEFAPRGHRFALVRAQPAARGHEVVVMAAEGRARAPRRLFAGAGAVAGVGWSPDGRWLLIAWDAANQWVFAPVAGGGAVKTAERVSRRFDAGEPPGPQLPTLAGWCCAR